MAVTHVVGQKCWDSARRVRGCSITDFMIDCEPSPLGPREGGGSFAPFSDMSGADGIEYRAS